MSRLEFYNRPLVQFDAGLREHRQIYYKFIELAAWGHSPYRFIVPDGTQSDLIGMIKNEMINHYIHKEFGKPAPKPEKLIRQKRKKTVDKQPKEQYNKTC